MQAIVDSIGRVRSLVGEIAAASAEQTRGINQVNSAVVQMDRATQQNAHLLQQASGAARSLATHGDGLAEAVRGFRLDTDVPAGAAIEAARSAGEHQHALALQ